MIVHHFLDFLGWVLKFINSSKLISSKSSSSIFFWICLDYFILYFLSLTFTCMLIYSYSVYISLVILSYLLSMCLSFYFIYWFSLIFSNCYYLSSIFFWSWWHFKIHFCLALQIFKKLISKYWSCPDSIVFWNLNRSWSWFKF